MSVRLKGTCSCGNEIEVQAEVEVHTGWRGKRVKWPSGSVKVTAVCDCGKRIEVDRTVPVREISHY